MTENLLIPAKYKSNNIDMIRFILAASVIFCHSFVIYYGFEKISAVEPFMIWSRGQISIGSVVVDLFFIISGFLIVKSFENSNNTFTYLTKRVLRIFPGFIVAYTISILVVGFLGSGFDYNVEGYRQYFQYLDIKKELVHLFTLQNPYQKVFFKESPEPGVNESLWTIQFEFACYLLVILFAWLGLFKKKEWIIVAFLTVYLLLFFQMKGYILPYKNSSNLFFGNPYHFPRFITYFLAGACVYFYQHLIVRSKILLLISAIALPLSFAWIKCVDQVLPIAGTYLLFYLAFHPCIRFGNFAKYGDLSYGVYLYGWPAQALVMYFLKDYINPYSFFLTALPIAVIAAFCSWHLVENPFLKLKKNKKLGITNIPNQPPIE